MFNYCFYTKKKVFYFNCQQFVIKNFVNKTILYIFAI